MSAKEALTIAIMSIKKDGDLTDLTREMTIGDLENMIEFFELSKTLGDVATDVMKE